MRRIIISLIAGMLIIPFSVSCASTKGYACPPKHPKHMTVVGTLRMVGSEPMTELILETPDNETFEIQGDKKKELSLKQGYKVKISGGSAKPTGVAAKQAIKVENYEILQE